MSSSCGILVPGSSSLEKLSFDAFSGVLQYLDTDDVTSLRCCNKWINCKTVNAYHFQEMNLIRIFIKICFKQEYIPRSLENSPPPVLSYIINPEEVFQIAPPDHSAGLAGVKKVVLMAREELTAAVVNPEAAIDRSEFNKENRYPFGFDVFFDPISNDYKRLCKWVVSRK